MTLSDISIKNRVFAAMLMLSLVLFGFISFTSLGVSELPEVEFPVVSVSLTWEGAAPEVMESDVVDIVEDSVMSVQGIREVSSTTRQGTAEVTIEFELDRNIDTAREEVQSKISQAQQRLPREMDPPIVSKVNPTDHPILWISVSSTRPLNQLMSYVQDDLKDRFQSIRGVGDIILGGYVDRNLRVWVSQKKLDEYQLTVNDVIEAITENHAEIPAGRIETSEKEMNVRAMGEAATPEEFAEIVIGGRAGKPVYKPIRLKEIAKVEDSVADIRRIARIGDRKAVGLGIRKQRGDNAVAVAQRVKQRLKEIEKDLPKDIQMGINYDSTIFVEQSVGELNFTLILSSLLTALVCWMFLGSWSSTLNVILSIPTSIMGTFLAFKFAGFTLNTFTLLGLSLAIGIVVDDAIMVLENIYRYREQGRSKEDAAGIGSRQITFAALAATLALIAIFLPVVFMKGIIGKFFLQFGITISVAVALSLLSALTLTPMMASLFLTVTERTSGFGKWIERAFIRLSTYYKIALATALEKRWLVLSGATAFFILSLGLFGVLRKEFVPPQDQSIFLCKLQTPVGSSIEFTDQRFKDAEKFVANLPEVSRYLVMIGGFTGGEVNSGYLIVTLKPKHQRPVHPGKGRLSQMQVIDLFRKELNKIPNVEAFVQDMSLSGFTAQRGFPIEFTIRGRDWEKLASYSKKIMDEMKKSGLMVDVDTDYQLGVTEVRVRPNRQKAQERGVDMRTIGDAINALFGGQRVGKYTQHGRRYDVRVKLVPGERLKPEDISKVNIWNNRGEMVCLADVCDIQLTPSLLSITRHDRERAIAIFANVAPGKSQAIALQEIERIAHEILPDGYRMVSSGSAKVFQESFSSFFFALLLGIIVAYMVLASQFNSTIHPLTVLLALPFSVSGALIALFVGNQSVNIYSLIGILLLMGIVKKNSILLVEFTNHMRAEGKGVHQALLEACPIRLRPILMTSFATIAAAIPPALALGPGSETRTPMAVTIIGGVFFSTLLTLLVVPCAYRVFSKPDRPAGMDGLLALYAYFSTALFGVMLFQTVVSHSTITSKLFFLPVPLAGIFFGRNLFSFKPSSVFKVRFFLFVLIVLTLIQFVLKHSPAMILAAIMAGAWLAYFLFSDRVKKTYLLT